MFTVHTKTETLATFANLQDANAYAVENAQPKSGIAVTLPQGGEMSLWDFRAWSTMACKRLANRAA